MQIYEKDACASAAFSDMVARLYGRDEGIFPRQQARYRDLLERFTRSFGKPGKGAAFFSAPGRTEIGGNHTDHNNGLVMAAAVDLDMVALAEPTDDRVITVKSEGFPAITVSIQDLAARREDFGTTRALVRGTAYEFAARGMEIGGFRAVVTSNVLRGSGLSSSAAFEVLMAAIMDGLYNGFKLSAYDRAVIAQRVENIHFGKPCGLMDQMASSWGGMIQIDFGPDPASVQALSCDFTENGYALAVVNTGGNHGDLTEDYAAIRREMEAVAAVLDGSVLRDTNEDALLASLPAVRAACGDRAVLRALHYFDENRRVPQMAEAIQKKDFVAFFSIVNASGESSWQLLQNVYARPNEEQMALGIELSRRFLRGDGAARVHGGGFAGTIQAYVPLSRLAAYRQAMDGVFGAGSTTTLRVRPDGAVMLALTETVA